MKTAIAFAIALLSIAPTVDAQTASDLQIRVGLYTTKPDGGENPAGMWYSTGPAVVGKTFVSTWSVGEPCESFTLSGGRGVGDRATTLWRMELTPISVQGDAVKFRLRWQMYDLRPKSAGPGPYSDDQELTLRPGESRPLIAVRSFTGFTCDDAASIRISVDAYPSPEEEKRLVSAELWLVERVANGGEVQRSQPLYVRGLPNRVSPFYFDSIVDANMTLDMYGELVSRLDGDAIAVSIETRSRWRPEPRNIMGPQKSVSSEIRVKPGETVDIRLPLLGSEAGPFAKRAFSIRIRAHQIR